MTICLILLPAEPLYNGYTPDFEPMYLGLGDDPERDYVWTFTLKIFDAVLSLRTIVMKTKVGRCICR